MRVLPFFKPRKGWHVAGTNLENDSGGGSYVLPIASADTLGGMKVGDGLSINESGVLSTSGGGGGSLDYTTEEQDTGRKWIDGKEIYVISARWSSGEGYNSYNLGTGKNVLPITSVSEENASDEISKAGTWSYNSNGNFYVSVTGSGGTHKVATIYYTKNS